MFTAKSLENLFKKFGQVKAGRSGANVKFVINANTDRTLRLSVLRRFKIRKRVAILVNAKKDHRVCTLMRFNNTNFTVIACWRMDQSNMKYLSPKYIITEKMIYFMKFIKVRHRNECERLFNKDFMPQLPKVKLVKIEGFYKLIKGNLKVI